MAGHAAAQRFQNSLVNHGRLRQREADGNLCAYLPWHHLAQTGRQQRRRRSGSASFSPSDRIRDVLQDGDHVYVPRNGSRRRETKAPSLLSKQRSRHINHTSGACAPYKKSEHPSETEKGVRHRHRPRCLQSLRRPPHPKRDRAAQAPSSRVRPIEIRDLADKNNHEDPS